MTASRINIAHLVTVSGEHCHRSLRRKDSGIFLACIRAQTVASQLATLSFSPDINCAIFERNYYGIEITAEWTNREGLAEVNCQPLSKGSKPKASDPSWFQLRVSSNAPAAMGGLFGTLGVVRGLPLLFRSADRDK